MPLVAPDMVVDDIFYSYPCFGLGAIPPDPTIRTPYTHCLIGPPCLVHRPNHLLSLPDLEDIGLQFAGHLAPFLPLTE